MTDQEIEKALEACKDDNWRCNECKYYCGTGDMCVEECERLLAKDALDYINRLKAENEHYKQMECVDDCTICPHTAVVTENFTANLDLIREQTRKNTAKEIFRKLKIVIIGTGKDIGIDGIKVVARDFDIEVDE